MHTSQAWLFCLLGNIAKERISPSTSLSVHAFLQLGTLTSLATVDAWLGYLPIPRRILDDVVVSKTKRLEIGFGTQ